MDPKDSSDNLEGIKNGDPSCMAGYIESRRHDLMVLILSKMGAGLRKKVEADDVYQEVCKTAIESFQKIQFDERGPFGWLVELIDRKVVDLKRKFETQKRDFSKEVGIHGSGSDRIGFVNLLVASITSPSKAFSRKQKEFQILAAMENLSQEQQAVLDLRYAKGMSCKEIAEKIGKSDGATRVLISRSLSKLRSEVGNNDSENETS